MSKSLYFVDMENVDNSNTLYANVIVKKYPPDLWAKTLNNTKILRNLLIHTIKLFVDKNFDAIIKEFSSEPPSAYDFSSSEIVGLREISTDFLIIKNALTLDLIDSSIKNISEKYLFAVEALNYENISLQSWDTYLNSLAFFYGEINGMSSTSPRISKIYIDNIITILKKWNDSKNSKFKLSVEKYILDKKIISENTPAWGIPFASISDSHWEHFSFTLSINDFEIYDDTNKIYLDYIAKQLFLNGFFEEIVIIINHFFWGDNFLKLFKWLNDNMSGVLVSFRFKTISSINKNIFLQQNLNKYNQNLFMAGNQEEIATIESRLPNFLNQILDGSFNTYGFEFDGGYFGNEGYLPMLDLNTAQFEEYKSIIKKTLNTNPFGTINDDFTILFNSPTESKFICLKGD